MPFMKMQVTEEGIVPTGIISDNAPETTEEIWFNLVETNESYDPTYQSRAYVVAGPMVFEKIITDESKVYLAQRKAMYPSIEEQLDTMYHKGVTGWKSMITKIKNECPKPDPTVIEEPPVEETPES